jgi:hypothetical protein
MNSRKRLTLAMMTVLPLAALALPGQAASHQKIVYIDQYDQDLDGRVSSTEFEAARRARFDITDTDHSASVSPDEYVFEWEDRLDAQLATDRNEQVSQTATRFDSLDEDENALISRAEFEASGDYSFARFDSNKDGMIAADDEDAMATEIANHERELSRAQILVNQKRMLEMPSTHSKEGTLTQYDVDSDDIVTLTEFKTGRENFYQRMDENSDGGVTEDEYTSEFEDRVDAAIAAFRKHSVEQAYTRFGALDGNKNKDMTFAEYQISGHRTFTRWDTDGDGYVTLEEPEPLPEEEAIDATTAPRNS